MRVIFEYSNLLSLGLEFKPRLLKDIGHKNCDLMAGGHFVSGR